MTARLSHFGNMDPSNGCYTRLSFNVQIVKRKGLSSEEPPCPGEDLPTPSFLGAQRPITASRGSGELGSEYPQDQSRVYETFIGFPQLGKPILGFKHLGALAPETQKVPDTSRANRLKDDCQAKGL